MTKIVSKDRLTSIKNNFERVFDNRWSIIVQLEFKPRLGGRR